MKQEFHFSVNANTKLVEALHQQTQFHKSKIKLAMQKGAVWLENGHGIHRIRRADKLVNASDKIHFYYNEKVLQITPPTPTLIADENDYSVWLKPRGMLSQGSKWSDHCTLHRWIETHQRFNDSEVRSCYVVHRLDKETCGLMFIAHKKTTAAQLTTLFEQRKIDKRYYALVKGEFPKTFNQNKDSSKPIQIESNIQNKYAKTVIKRLQFNETSNQSLIDINIETGRKHQIRIHCADYGFAIVGDTKYGAHDSDIAMQLQCYQLAILNNQHLPSRSFQVPLALDWPTN